MNATRIRPTLAALAGASLLLAACGGSDSSDDAGAVDTPVDAPADEPAAESADAPADEPTDGGSGLNADLVGTGVLRIDGVEATGFEGDCEISRGFGAEDVGDVSVGDISIIVAIDNVDAGDPNTLDDDLNFLMTSEDRFRVRTTNNGTVESISEIGTRTSDGSRDYTTIVVAGTLEDGRAVEAEVVCVLQNQF